MTIKEVDLTFEMSNGDQKVVTFELDFGNLNGDKGEKGDTGPQGPQGPKGDTGPQGPAAVIKHASGNISLNYEDNPASENATGIIGDGCYMKSVAYLSAGNDALGIIQLNEIPCKQDGTPIAYNLTQGSVKTVSESRVIPFTLTFGEIPLYKMDPSSKEVTALYRSSDRGAIAAIPMAADGQAGSEFTYSTSMISI